MLSTFTKYYHTLKYLKFTQIYYQLKYRWRKAIGYRSTESKKIFIGKSFEWINVIRPNTLWNAKNDFTFLNLSSRFEESIDWNDSTHGKLWTYNINYFEYLLQADVNIDVGIDIMLKYIDDYSNLLDGLEPYPTSLRIINWIKFINEHQIENFSVDHTIGKDAYRLMDNLEYHLLANHLLENGFALLFAGVYLQDVLLSEKGSQIICSQLKEQILKDGGHYELSPMYHQLMLHRVLDSIQLLRSTNSQNQLLLILERTAESMLGWLAAITFKDGSIPLVNDAANRVNATTNQLVNYANHLNLNVKSSVLSDSGYRKINQSSYELFVDIGNIKPSYQPGHAHADTFSYLINAIGSPFVVESGTSTYENNERRKYERSSAAHNTVVIDGVDSSNVWSSFRVSKRAKVNVIRENNKLIQAKHNGYSNGHSRSWNYDEETLQITDTLEVATNDAISYIHFHPEITIISNDDNIITSKGEIKFTGHTRIILSEYGYTDEFNKEVAAPVIKIYFSQSLTTKFTF